MCRNRSLGSRRQERAAAAAREFGRIGRIRHFCATTEADARRITGSYPLRGLAKCRTYGKAATNVEAKSGEYTCHIGHSLLTCGRNTCVALRRHLEKFQKNNVDELRANVRSKCNLRVLVKAVEEEID